MGVLRSKVVLQWWYGGYGDGTVMVRWWYGGGTVVVRWMVRWVRGVGIRNVVQG